MVRHPLTVVVEAAHDVNHIADRIHTVREVDEPAFGAVDAFRDDTLPRTSFVERMPHMELVVMRAVMPEDNDAEAIAPRRDTQVIHAPRVQHERGEEAHVTSRTRCS